MNAHRPKGSERQTVAFPEKVITPSLAPLRTSSNVERLDVSNGGFLVDPDTKFGYLSALRIGLSRGANVVQETNKASGERVGA